MEKIIEDETFVPAGGFEKQPNLPTVPVARHGRIAGQESYLTHRADSPKLHGSNRVSNATQFNLN